MHHSTTKASRITDRILVAIETGEYQLGTTLPLRSELARQFGTTVVLELGCPTNPPPEFWLITCSGLDRARRLSGLPLQERLSGESAGRFSAEVSIIATNRLRRTWHTRQSGPMSAAAGEVVPG